MEETKQPGSARTLWAAIIAVTVVGALHFASDSIGTEILTASRWLALGVLVTHGLMRRSLTTWIVVFMFIGGEIGHDFPAQADNLSILSKIFLSLIKCIIAPLILSMLVVGIAGHADLKQVGRMGIKALIYFEVVTTIALFIGLGAINFSKAGVGVHQASGNVETVAAPVKKTVGEIIQHVFPENIAKSVANGEVLQIAVFATIFGIGLAMVKPEKRAPLISLLESVAEAMFKFTNIVMLFAPLGVMGAMAYTVGKMGLGVLIPLLKLLFTLYGALIIFVLFVFVPIALIARIPLHRFLKAVAEPATIAFATASSESALPRAMENMERFGIPRQVVAFVLPTGYSFNLDGSTLYLALASVFVAQAAGIDLTFSEQLLMVFTLMLTSKGVAGVPRATLVILLGTAASFNLPTWPIFLILGIDQLMDMARTCTNVIGNCLATAVIARWEGELNVPEETLTA